MTPKVSVIIPTHNTIEFLPRAIESVLAQQIEDFEIIVIDDGSTDSTPQWLKEMAGKEPRLRYETTDRVGPSGARNIAISMAKGEFTAFLDSDDWWHPGKLARQISYMQESPDIAFCYSDYIHVDPQGGAHGTCFDYWRPSFAKRLPCSYSVLENAECEILACNTISTSTVVARTQSLRNANGFATHLQSAEDWCLWLRLAANAPVACSTMVTTSYLMRPGNVTSNRAGRIDALREIVAPYRLSRDAKMRRAVRIADARIARAQAEIARDQSDTWGACGAELKSLGLSPRLRSAKAAGQDFIRALSSGHAA